MGHVPEYSAQCLIGHCGACPDPDCEHYCHPALGPPPEALELELGTPASETEN